jgi:DNA-binding transcriptional MocR family regulator
MIFQRKIRRKDIRMLLKIDRNLSTPIYKQIIDKIKELIDQGWLELGQRLPSSRDLAEQLGVTRSTVCQAYAELQALGYLQSRPGSYNTVQQRRKEAVYNPEYSSFVDWKKRASADAVKLYEIFLGYTPERSQDSKDKDIPFDLTSITLDPRLYPLADFRRCIHHVLLDSGAESLQYGSYKGYPPLCEFISRRLRLHGISVSEDEILITSGAQQAIDLIARLFRGPGKAVIVESPTYPSAIPLLRFNGLKIADIPMRFNGMDLKSLEKTLSREKVAFVYTMPNFQNPTGITTGHHHRERLLDICLRQKVPIVEDGFEEDMKYYGKVDLPIKSIDDKNIVIYLGTFSKALFPGLRIGWITADKELIRRLQAIKRFCDLTSNHLAQIAIHRFCALGYYDKHIKKLHRVFRQKMEGALACMNDFFPSSMSWTHPVGGYTIWVKMPRKLSEKDLDALTTPFGVKVSPGEYYFPRRAPSEHFRISIAHLNKEEIQEALKRLGKALHKLA